MREQQFAKQEQIKSRREEKDDAVAQVIQKKKIKKISAWIITIILLGGLGYWAVVAGKRAEQNRPGESFESLGQEHIANEAQHDPYNSNPPTSGPHYSQPAPWGIYQQELPDEQIVHNLEHGGIWISYKEVDEETKDKLEEIGARFPGSVIVSPRSANDTPIALASWQRLEKLDNFDEERILNYIKANRNKSPEPIAR